MAARSAIMGARGNSGVILSQLLRGLGKGLAGKKQSYQQRGGQSFSVWYFVCLPGGIKAC